MDTLEKQDFDNIVVLAEPARQAPEDADKELARVLRMSQNDIAAYCKTATEERRQEILFALHVIHG